MFAGAENKLRIVYESAVDRTPGQPACIKRFPAALFAWQVGCYELWLFGSKRRVSSVPHMHSEDIFQAVQLRAGQPVYASRNRSCYDVKFHFPMCTSCVLLRILPAM